MQVCRHKERWLREKRPCKWSLLLLMIVIVTWSVAASAEDRAVVIVHPDVADETLSEDDLRGIFWGDKTRWGNGDRIAMALPARSPMRDAFLRVYIGRTDAQFRNHWRRIVFTGRGQMPREIQDEAVLLTYVATTPGAVSFIASSALEYDKKSVRILMLKD